jgi:hypothetical protein
MAQDWHDNIHLRARARVIEAVVRIVDPHEPILQDALCSPEHFAEALTIEERVRADPALLGSGMEVQFVACKP